MKEVVSGKSGAEGVFVYPVCCNSNTCSCTRHFCRVIKSCDKISGCYHCDIDLQISRLTG